MKKVKFLLDCFIASHGSVKAGAEIELDDDQADDLAAMGAVETSVPKKSKAKQAPSPAPLPVSAPEAAAETPPAE